MSCCHMILKTCTIRHALNRVTSPLAKWLALTFECVTVLLCFIEPILGNRYVRSQGFIVSEPKETHPRSEIADVPTSPCPPLNDLGCPDPHPPPYTSLATPIPSSSSSNGPTTTTLSLRLPIATHTLLQTASRPTFVGKQRRHLGGYKLREHA